MTRITPRHIREIILLESHRARVGHIGSCLSIAEIIAVLFDRILRQPGTDDPNRDRFILSKGHAVLALYAALYLKGILTREKLSTYCSDGSLLGSHPDHRLKGIDFSTGSLGHGPSIAAGSALGARLRGSPARAFVLLSDAELNEGSVWESALFAAHHRLSNLFAIVDENGQQAMGKTRDVLRMEPLAAKWNAFGWGVREVDGHNIDELEGALRNPHVADRPTLVIAHTVFGKGVSFMESRLEWHYFPINDEQLQRALGDLGAEA